MQCRIGSCLLWRVKIRATCRKQVAAGAASYLHRAITVRSQIAEWWASGAGPEGGAKPQPDEKVVDATFEEVDDKKGGRKPN